MQTSDIDSNPRSCSCREPIRPLKNRIFLLKMSLSVLMMGLLVWYLDLSDAYSTLRNVQIGYLVIVFLVINADRVLMGYKWKILLKVKNLDPPLSSLIRGYYLSRILDPVLPSTVGADVVRGISVAKTGIGSDNIFSSIIMERILGTLSLFLLALLTLGYFTFKKYHYLLNIFIYVFLLFILLIILFYYSLKKKYSTDNIQSKLPFLPNTFVSYFSKIYTSYLDYRNYNKHLFLFFALSVIEHLIVVYMNFLIIKGLGFQVTFVAIISTIPTIMFLSRLPISIGQIGIQEGAYVMLLSMVGLTLTDSVTISMVVRVVIFVSLLPVFLVSLASGEVKALMPLATLKEKTPELR